MIIGFTGSRKGMTPEALEALESVLSNHPTCTGVVHGCAIGADAQFHKVAMEHGFPILGSPSTLNAQSMPINKDEFAILMTRRGPLDRNHIIVDVCDLLIAAPETLVEVRRSGTWATMRYAKTQGRRCTVLGPVGTINPLGLII